MKLVGKMSERELRSELTLVRNLLNVAKCPNAHCVDGTIQEGFADDYEVFECQFCHDRKELLK